MNLVSTYYVYLCRVDYQLNSSVFMDLSIAILYIYILMKYYQCFTICVVGVYNLKCDYDVTLVFRDRQIDFYSLSRHPCGGSFWR